MIVAFMVNASAVRDAQGARWRQTWGGPSITTTSRAWATLELQAFESFSPLPATVVIATRCK